MYYNATFALASFLMAVLFLAVGVIFLLGKEKAAILISGFNFKSKEERLLYDRKRMSKDMQKRCFLYSALYFAGAFFSYMVGAFFFGVIVIAWLILFLSQVRLNPEKAFEKYKLKNDVEKD